MTTPGSGAATDVPQFSELDQQMALAVVTQPLDDPVQHIVTLSDEELLAIEGIQYRQLTPLPWADENLRTPEERAVAVATATRGLIARGLVTTTKIKDPRLADEPGPEDEIAPALRGTVVARRNPDWVIAAERTTTQGRALGTFYVFDLEAERRAIFEVYDDMGMHLFFALSLESLGEQFWLWVDPAREAGDIDGDPEEFPAGEFSSTERGAGLGQARAATAVMVRGREQEVADAATFTLFAQPGQLDLMESDQSGQDAVVRIAPITQESLGELVLSLIEKPASE